LNPAKGCDAVMRHFYISKVFHIALNGLVLLLQLLFFINTCGATIFSWTDKNGVTHFTDSAAKIPMDYRERKIEGLNIIEEDLSKESPNSYLKSSHSEAQSGHLNEYKVPLISTNNGNFIVRAKLNKGVKVKLMLDTGASLISISSEISKKLGIKKILDLPRINFQTANGIVLSPLLVLDRVKIGDVEVDTVEASISQTMEGIDGLLGMSFLSNFRIEINRIKSQLILKPLAKPGEQVWDGKPAFWWESKFKYYNMKVNEFKLKEINTKDFSSTDKKTTKVVRFYDDLYKKLAIRASYFGLPKKLY
jgi:clan AA aspartic protease (TIGR02281 family)